ncbi:DUF5683 domain-containing protein [Flavobacterium sp.]|uniref:DUF5683 domain-containing protein n=1 Tax=Flavobacterium sp. TaxID=239 RepID=UPI002B4B3BEA|nr:DUF5683 domain-containing protein [Flavobacterium sp.]HLP64420.1 DUF5683 domain-containing protein [Flavobacterium sp.]
MKSLFYIALFFFIGTTLSLAQDELKVENIKVKDSTAKKSTTNPLAPSKAAFYSAILPGLGQAYNKKYWKIPIVYGAIGTGVYSYMWNNKKYHQYRDAYKNRLAGKPDDFSYLDNDRLIQGQRFYQKNRDLSAIVTVGLYILNIVDANVDAHLMQFNVNDNLSVKPDLQQDDLYNRQNLALTLSYNF